MIMIFDSAKRILVFFFFTNVFFICKDIPFLPLGSAVVPIFDIGYAFGIGFLILLYFCFLDFT